MNRTGKTRNSRSLFPKKRSEEILTSIVRNLRRVFKREKGKKKKRQRFIRRVLSRFSRSDFSERSKKEKRRARVSKERTRGTIGVEPTHTHARTHVHVYNIIYIYTYTYVDRRCAAVANAESVFVKACTLIPNISRGFLSRWAETAVQRRRMERKEEEGGREDPE